MKWTHLINNIAKSKDGRHEIHRVSNKFLLFTQGALIITADRLREAKAIAK